MNSGSRFFEFSLLVPRTYLDLGRRSNLALEFFRLDPLLQHADLVFVKALNAVHDQLLLGHFLLLSLLKLALLFQELVLLQVRGQLVNLLAEAHLLSISLVHKTLLLVYQLLFELFLSDLLQLHLTGQLPLETLLLILPVFVAVLLLLVVSFK